MADGVTREAIREATRDAAASAGPSGLPRHDPRCRCLRWKGMYIDAEPDPEVPNTSDGLYWCVHTSTCLGPDGKAAGAGACSAGRGCFETR